MNNNIITYPTEWSHGKPRGVIKENPTNYQLRITLYDENNKPNDRNIYFLFKSYNSKEDCYKDCIKKRLELSDENKLTRNKIRYLDKDTIEVKLTLDKTMKTDSKNLDKVEKYPLSVKQKKSKDGKDFKYYAICQDKKTTFPFVNLITKSKDVYTYKNGDSLDLRLDNLKLLTRNKEIFIDNNENKVDNNENKVDNDNKENDNKK